MSTMRTDYWKIGLVVAAGIVVAVIAIFWVGAQRFNRPQVERVTYFDESVQGLDVGAPVKMRGVTIGKVVDITIAPDRRLVQVTASIYEDIWVRLGLGTVDELRSAARPLPEDLRVQLSTTGVTGVKILQVDFFPLAEPPLELSFQPPFNYIPSTQSTLKSLEDSFNMLASAMPGALTSIDELATTLNATVKELDVPALQARLDDLLVKADALIANLDAKLATVDLERLSDRGATTLETLNEALGKADALITELQSDEGPLKRLSTNVEGLVTNAETTLEGADLPGTTAELRRAISSYDALAAEGSALSGELIETLLVLRETLASVQALANYLERQPGALLRGRVPDSPIPAPDDR